MRRKDKEISDRADLEAIIRQAVVCRLAFISDNVPYIVPLNYGFRDNCLYFHSAPQGHKIDALKRNDSVCFEMEIDVELVESDSVCKWGTKYRSVVGHGKAFFIEKTEEKKEALDIIVGHYQLGGFDYPPANIDKLVAIGVEIESMTGKRSGF